MDNLRRIAAKITPPLVSHDMKRVLASMEMESIYMSISGPEGLSKDEMITRAKALIPCDTGAWEDIDTGPGWIAGNMECEPGFYEANEEGGEYGPDDAGVTVSWEHP